uniref:Excreted virulence factor EspC, type VII ESX diderm n=1 Tax=Streptomyces sp. NBC_01393 TaxID=2903851 RepID=A0AAU3HVT3_9ACTN
MSFLKFAGDAVKEMAGTLETSGGQMKSASKEMKHADSSQIGHNGLESACDDFADSWDYGFGQLSKLTKDVSKFANKAAEEFTKLDQKLYDELKKKAGEGKR